MEDILINVEVVNEKIKQLINENGDLATLAILAANRLGDEDSHLKERIYRVAYRETSTESAIDPICTCGHKARDHGEFRCFMCEPCHLGESDVLRAALEKAQEDTRRLDWLNTHREKIVRSSDDAHICNAWRVCGMTDDVREAIDAALRPTTEEI